MSVINVKLAFEKRLAAMTGGISTAREAMPFTPQVGTPYQRINFLRAASENLVQGRKITRLHGIAQITLFYPAPVATGTTLADAMAVQIVAWFKPVLTMTEGTTKVHVTDAADIATGFADGDRWVVPVSIPWQADIYG